MAPVGEGDFKRMNLNYRKSLGIQELSMRPAGKERSVNGRSWSRRSNAIDDLLTLPDAIRLTPCLGLGVLSGLICAGLDGWHTLTTINP